MSVPPKEDGATLELRAKPRPVTRLSRKVIAVLLVLIGLIVLFAFSWGLRKPKPKSLDAPAETHNVERVAHAEGLASLPKDYSGVPKLGPSSGEFGQAMLQAEKEAGVPQLPERAGFKPNAEEDALRAQQLKEKNEAEEAAKAQILVTLKSRHAKSNPLQLNSTPRGDRTDPLSTLARPMTLGQGTGTEGKQDHQEKMQSFVDKEADPKVYSTSSLQIPRSPYQLMAGTLIPAALVTGIKSDLPGQVIATVTENVFDSVTGNALLIPQGSRLLGQYASQIAWGQSRVLLVWTRLILPDGSSLVLDRLPGVDAEGYAGLQDRTDWHWRRIFAGAALSTLLGAGAELAAPDRVNGDRNVIVATRESLQDMVNQVGQELTRRNLNIQPTLTERPGLPVKIVVNKDLMLQPYGLKKSGS